MFRKRFDDKTAPNKHTLTLHDDDNDIFEYSSASDPCMFLSKDLECTIYEKRPLICRMYPILWQEKRRSEDMDYFVDYACPLAHRLPVRDFFNWIHEYEKLVMEMGELDFNYKMGNYVNISHLMDEVNIVELAIRKDLVP